MTRIIESKTKSVRFEYSAGDPIYKGVHESFYAATSDEGWEIYKYTWTDSSVVQIQGPISGTWDGRAGLGW